MLQDLAKSVWNGTVPSSKSPELVNDRPSTVNVFGQLTGVSAVTAPLSSRPSAVIILNVEPGGTDAVKARLSSPPSGPLATATIAPSLTRTATSAVRRRLPGQRRVGRVLDLLVERGLERRAGLGVDREELDRPPRRLRSGSSGR